MIMMNVIMKKYLGPILLILALSLPQLTLAQADDEKPYNWVNIDEMSAVLKKDSQGAWYYQVEGKIQRDVDDDMYLMLRNSQGQGAPIQLIAYYLGSPINIRFPNCDDSQFFNCSEVDTTSAVLEPGVSYELYFSSDSSGYQPISDIYDQLQVIPEPTGNDPGAGNTSGTQSGNTPQNTNQGSQNTPSSRSGSSARLVSGEQQEIIDNGIVPLDCGYNIRSLANRDGTGRICGFTDLIRLIQRIIEYIFVLILPLAALVFAYAGFLYLTSGGSASKRDAARKAMTNVLIGIIIVMLAWIAVKTLLVALGVDESFLIYLDI